MANGSAGRSRHAMVYNSARGVTTLFGGLTLQSFDPDAPGSLECDADVWEWNGSAWAQRVVGGPSPRSSHAMAFDDARGATVVFGGVWGTNRYDGATWEWNGKAWTRYPAGGPSAREGHAMAYDSARGVTVLFGGSLIAADTWEWNGSAWARRNVSGPSGRYGHAMVYDSARRVVVLFGGLHLATLSAETWEWDGNTWTQRMVPGPSARVHHAMAYDSARGVTVLFGGGGFGYPRNAETWEWNGTAWSQRMVVGPQARGEHAMSYDSARGVTVLYGGSTGTRSDELWEWAGTAWSRRTLGGPSVREDHAMVYDSIRGKSVLFGGIDRSTPVAEIWELGVPCTLGIATQPDAQTAYSGGIASFSVVAEGTGPFTFQWQVNTATPAAPQWCSLTDLQPGGGCGGNGGSGASHAVFLGIASPGLTITGLSPADAKQYRCVVTSACGRVSSTAARLTICAADFNVDGFLDFFDYRDFVVCFETQDCSGGSADFNNDGFVDFFDYASFVDAFELGC